MRVYFLKLKSLIDEIVNYKLILNYTCGGLRAIIKKQEKKNLCDQIFHGPQ